MKWGSSGLKRKEQKAKWPLWKVFRMEGIKRKKICIILYRNGLNEIEKAVKSQSSFSNGLEDILRIFKEEYPEYTEELEIDAIRKIWRNRRMEKIYNS